MAEVLKTKSQMILRIAELSEQNTLLRDELYKKSETEQALQTALEENAELKEKLKYLEDRLQLRMASDKESDEFWDEVFSEEDYPFNKENAYKELKDYYFVLNQIPSIYMELTGGMLSKTTYFASSVIQAHYDCIDRKEERIDDLEFTLKEIKEIAEDIEKNDVYENSDYKAIKIQEWINEVLK